MFLTLKANTSLKDFFLWVGKNLSLAIVDQENEKKDPHSFHHHTAWLCGGVLRKTPFPLL